MNNIQTIDQIGSNHIFTEIPQRIISLVPSITELLCALGLEDNIVGCTRFCVHPIDIGKRKIIIGGTKKLDLKRIKALSPDIVIANKEENRKEDVEEIKSISSVWVSDVPDVSASYEMISLLGALFGKRKLSESLISDLRQNLRPLSISQNRVCYLIWRKPFMTIGGNTYINSMLHHLGLANVFEDKKRYPEISVADMLAKKPDHLFLSSEPFPFKEQHIAELKALTGMSSIHCVDGEYFSWYGVRQLNCGGYRESLEGVIF